jgi:hypothetical protein
MTTTRYIGNCQICEGDQKLHEGHMVHHGYRRPGDGYIHGDCPGVHEVPYEVSCELIKTVKANTETFLAGRESYLADLKAGRVTHLCEAHQRGAWSAPELVDYYVGVTEPYVWAQAVESATWKVEGTIRQCKADIARYTARIAAWKRMPIRTVEEEEAKTAAAKAERAKEVAAARAVRQAKKDATKAKQDALKARREQIKADIIARVTSLAASPDISALEVRTAAQKIAKEIRKHTWLWLHDLNCDEALVKLGIATRGSHGGRAFLN